MPEPFDRALRAAARRDRTSGVCPDTEVLAAYVDGRLTGRERTALEAHAADCPACVQHLGLLGRASLDGGVQTPRGPWIVRWGLLVPVATAVLVVAIWTRLPDEPSTSVPSTAREVAARSGVDDDADRTGGAGRAFLREHEAPVQEFGTRPPAAAPPAVPPPRAEAAYALRDGSGPGTLAKASPAQPESPEGEPTARLAAPAAPPAASDTIALPTRAAQTPAAPLSPAPPPARERASASLPDALQRQANEGAFRALTSAEQAAPAIVAGWARDWYRATGGRIEVSPDAGATWREAFSDATVTFTAAACADGGACWFGTSDGQVLRNEPDGFARSTLPTRARVVALAAGLNDRVWVTVEGDSRFRSTDGGRTWSREP